MHKQNLLTSLLLSFVILPAYGNTADTSQMTNQLQSLYSAKQAPARMNIKKPVLCLKKSEGDYQKWQYGETLNPFKITGHPTYAVADLRMGGCKKDDTYYGTLTLIPGSIKNYSIKDRYHIQLKNRRVDNKILKGGLGFTPIGAGSDDFPTNKQKPGQTHWFTGVNLSGFEFSKLPNPTVIPNLSVEDQGTVFSDLKATKQILKQGANTIRLPVRWAYIQPYGPSKLLPHSGRAYLNKLYMPTVEKLVDNGYFVIVDLHAYMHYASAGSHVAGCSGKKHTACPQGHQVTNPQAYVEVWKNIWKQLQDNNIDSHYILADIVNEPASNKNKPDIKPQTVFNMEIKVIASLYKQGFKGRYLLEGTDWSGLHSWEQSGNATVYTRSNMLSTLQNNGLSQKEAKNLIDNKIIINVHQYFDNNFSGTSNNCQTNLGTTGKKGFNLNAFTNYLKQQKLKAMVTEFGVGNNQSQCQKALNKFLGNYINKNHYTPKKGYGYVGWTAWSTGHGWGDYKLRIKPGDWKAKTLKQYYELKS